MQKEHQSRETAANTLRGNACQPCSKRDNARREFQSFFLKQVGIIFKNTSRHNSFFKKHLSKYQFWESGTQQSLIIGFMENFDYHLFFFFWLKISINHMDLSSGSGFVARQRQMFSRIISQISMLNLLFKKMEICRDITPFCSCQKVILSCFPDSDNGDAKKKNRKRLSYICFKKWCYFEFRAFFGQISSLLSYCSQKYL